MKDWNKMREKNITENVVQHIDLGRCFELATTNKRYVNGLNKHDYKNEILIDYKSDFEVIGSTLVVEIEQKTKIRFENVDDFETYILILLL